MGPSCQPPIHDRLMRTPLSRRTMKLRHLCPDVCQKTVTPAPVIPGTPSSGPAPPSTPSDLPRLRGCQQCHAGWRPSWFEEAASEGRAAMVAEARENHSLTEISPPITLRYPPP